MKRVNSYIKKIQSVIFSENKKLANNYIINHEDTLVLLINKHSEGLTEEGIRLLKKRLKSTIKELQ